MIISRRSFLYAFSSLTTLSMSEANSRDEHHLTQAEINQILREELEPSMARAYISAFWYQLPASSRPEPGWPEDINCHDYNHLVSSELDRAVTTITPDTIESYLRICHFPVTESAKLMFGLRGASLDGGADWAPPAASQRIVQARPDHLHAKCLIGVLDRQKHSIALATGSTVPNVDLMLVAAKRDGRGCNMLPTGYHPYKVGPHRGARQPGAFRQQRAMWVLRARKTLTYSLADPYNRWDDGEGSLPMDDIHAAMLSYNKTPPYFSSAGCQVVTGAYSRSSHQPIGPWAEFRKAAGLSSPIRLQSTSGRTADDGRSVDYLLLTGKEASLVSLGKLDPVRTLRYGAVGEVVRTLQKALAVPLTTVFDRTTMGKLLSWQRANSRPPTGILTSEQAQLLNVELG